MQSSRPNDQKDLERQNTLVTKAENEPLSKVQNLVQNYIEEEVHDKRMIFDHKYQAAKTAEKKREVD